MRFGHSICYILFCTVHLGSGGIIQFDKVENMIRSRPPRERWRLSDPEEEGQQYSRQGSSQVPILMPLPEIPSSPGVLPPSEDYLPDLGFLADFGSLVTRDFPASPFVRLSRDLFESEQCAQLVSCRVSGFSNKYQPLRWIHNFLDDFPFKGDLADKLKVGTRDSLKDEGCSHRCNPLGTLTRGLKMLSLLQEVVQVSK